VSAFKVGQKIPFCDWRGRKQEGEVVGVEGDTVEVMLFPWGLPAFVSVGIADQPNMKLVLAEVYAKASRLAASDIGPAP